MPLSEQMKDTNLSLGQRTTGTRIWSLNCIQRGLSPTAQTRAITVKIQGLGWIQPTLQEQPTGLVP